MRYFFKINVMLLTGCCTVFLVSDMYAQSGVAVIPPQLISSSISNEKPGQRDFDFEIGTWKTHLSRLQHPLSGSVNWVEYKGTTVVREVWNGMANLVELDVKNAIGGRITALSLRLFNPQTGTWSLHFANSIDGEMGVPCVGMFKNGRGEFFNEDTFNGKKILVRFRISDITLTSCHFEQAFSEDNGETWEVNWIATDTRIN